MNKLLFIICITVAIDATGIGIVFPISPKLLQDMNVSGDIPLYVGLWASICALMQFVFSPILGALIDKIGHLPVLLFANA
ncbi:MAG: transporter, family, tetracycline resistance protein [Shewanella sp.]|jgi:DHA1 family tetracycline resistance protein-like MFS transporter|nr:transporter, family, tetracycline resistance protein [Shewanella sp.]